MSESSNELYGYDGARNGRYEGLILNTSMHIELQNEKTYEFFLRIPNHHNDDFETYYDHKNSKELIIKKKPLP